MDDHNLQGKRFVNAAFLETYNAGGTGFHTDSTAYYVLLQEGQDDSVCVYRRPVRDSVQCAGPEGTFCERMVADGSWIEVLNPYNLNQLVLF